MAIVQNYIILLCIFSASLGFHLDNIDEIFNSYKIKFNKKYLNSREELYRKTSFIYNLHRYMEHNAKYFIGEVSYHVGFNPFSDQLTSELPPQGPQIFIEKQTNVASMFTPTNAVVPDTFDWRDKKAVSPVPDSEGCVSNWAFAATGAIESQLYFKNGDITLLSAQDLIDCSTYNHGCWRGDPLVAFDDIVRRKGIDTEESYPYEGVDHPLCRFKESTVGARLSSYVKIQQNETVLKEAVFLNGPVAALINMRTSLQDYTGGIYSNDMCNLYGIPFGVLIVGYGRSNDQDYWIVRNSWGRNWGIDGYFYLARNKGNMCLIASNAGYPILK